MQKSTRYRVHEKILTGGGGGGGGIWRTIQLISQYLKNLNFIAVNHSVDDLYE